MSEQNRFVKNENCLCKVPCNCLPLVAETNYMVALKPTIHCDRTAEFHVLIYLISGSMEIIEDGVVYNLTPNSIFFLKKGLHHTGRKQFAIGTEWYYIHFYADEPSKDWKPMTKNIHYGDWKCYVQENYQRYIELPKFMQLPENNEIKRKMQEMAERFPSADNAEMIRLSANLWDLLLLIYERNQNIILKQKNDRRIQKVIAFVEENYCRNFSSKEIEKESELSYKYISTLFRQETGMTVKEYQIKLRIAKAEWYLEHTAASMSDIAVQLGFYDAFSFSKIFKREKGIAPMGYRNNYIPRM